MVVIVLARETDHYICAEVLLTSEGHETIWEDVALRREVMSAVLKLSQHKRSRVEVAGYAAGGNVEKASTCR